MICVRDRYKSGDLGKPAVCMLHARRSAISAIKLRVQSRGFLFLVVFGDF